MNGLRPRARAARGIAATLVQHRDATLLAVVLTATMMAAVPCAGRAASPWGVRVGAASATLYSAGDSDPRIGPVIGAWFRAEGQRFGFSIEALYMRQGGEGVVLGAGYSSDGGTLLLVRQDVVLDYLQMPLLVHVRVEGTTLRLAAGPAMGVLLDSEATYVDDARQQIEWDLDGWLGWTREGNLDHPPHTEVSLWLGAAVEARVGGRSLGLAVHYQLGLRDLDLMDRTVRNRVLMGALTVGL